MFIGNLPRATAYPSIAYVSVSTSIIFYCESNGPVSYKWMRKNGRIPPRATGKKNGTLTLHNVQPEDADYYRCVATSTSGSNPSNYVELVINSKILYCIHK